MAQTAMAGQTKMALAKNRVESEDYEGALTLSLEITNDLRNFSSEAPADSVLETASLNAQRLSVVCRNILQAKTKEFSAYVFEFSYANDADSLVAVFREYVDYASVSSFRNTVSGEYETIYQRTKDAGFSLNGVPGDLLIPGETQENERKARAQELEKQQSERESERYWENI